jgi:hypothetical protein
MERVGTRVGAWGREWAYFVPAISMFSRKKKLKNTKKRKQQIEQANRANKRKMCGLAPCTALYAIAVHARQTERWFRKKASRALTRTKRIFWRRNGGQNLRPLTTLQTIPNAENDDPTNAFSRRQKNLLYTRPCVNAS